MKGMLDPIYERRSSDLRRESDEHTKASGIGVIALVHMFSTEQSMKLRHGITRGQSLIYLKESLLLKDSRMMSREVKSGF